MWDVGGMERVKSGLGMGERGWEMIGLDWKRSVREKVGHHILGGAYVRERVAHYILGECTFVGYFWQTPLSDEEKCKRISPRVSLEAIIVALPLLWKKAGNDRLWQRLLQQINNEMQSVSPQYMADLADSLTELLPLKWIHGWPGGQSHWVTTINMNTWLTWRTVSLSYYH